MCEINWYCYKKTEQIQDEYRKLEEAKNELDREMKEFELYKQKQIAEFEEEK